MKSNLFQRRKVELVRRVDNIIAGLSSIGLQSVQLDTQSLLELYYNTYNPTTSTSQKLVDVSQLRVSE